jgi:hypothetical protein
MEERRREGVTYERSELVESRSINAALVWTSQRQLLSNADCHWQPLRELTRDIGKKAQLIQRDPAIV